MKFSLAGVQLKFTGNADGDRLTAPARGETGRSIIKLGSERFPNLPEAEFAAMQMASAMGVRTAPCRLISRDAIRDIPAELLQHGENVLVVDRFDRSAGGRIQIEDTGQVLGAVGDRKYTMGTTETVINIVRRFSTDHRDAVLEAVRRVVADVLLKNGDNHPKNWSFYFPRAGQIRLSPAYDIVPTVLYLPQDEMALRFVRTHSFEAVKNLHRFERVASFIRLDPKLITRAVDHAVRQALETWPKIAPALLGSDSCDRILRRLDTLTLVQEVRVRIGL